jgi:RNA 3'-terminal phosphate cyclase (ATP)
VGEEAANELLNSLKTKSALDEHMGDQIIPYMAMAGKSEVEISNLTMHTLTNLNVVQKFLSVEFEVICNGNVLDFQDLEKKFGVSGQVIIKSK